MFDPDCVDIAYTYKNLGMAYYNMVNHQMAKGYYKRV